MTMKKIMIYISYCIKRNVEIYCHFYQHINPKCDVKLTKIPKRDFIFARVKTGQVGT